jgi:hypothetical protein
LARIDSERQCWRKSQDDIGEDRFRMTVLGEVSG